MHNLPSMLLLLVAIANLLLGLIVLKSNSKKTENRLFAVFLFAAIFWALGDVLMLYSDSYDLSRMGAVLFYVAPLITTLFVVLFSFVFPDDKPIGSKTVIALCIPTAVIFVALSIKPDLALQSIEIVQGGQNIITHNKNAYRIYSLYFNIYFVIAYIKLISSYRKSNGASRKRIAYAFWSIFIASFAALFTNLTLPLLGNGQYVFAGPLFLLIFATVVAFGIVRHKLFDIRLVVARSLGYLLSIFAVAAIYGFFAFNIVSQLVFGGEVVDPFQYLTYTALAVVIAFTFQPLKEFFDRWTNRIFYRDAYDAQVLIDELNQVFVSTLELNRMLKTSAEIIEINIKTEFCVFGIKATDFSRQRIISNSNKKFEYNDVNFVKKTTSSLKQKIIQANQLEAPNIELRKRMTKNDVAILVRLTSDVDVEGVGYIVLGPKKSGNPYNSQDIKVLEIIANSMVIAIDNALRFEEIQKFNVTLQENIDDATRQLRHTNEKLKSLDETKDEFISMASHQLRTPLTSVKGYLSMVIEGDAGKLNPQQEKLLSQAFTSSQRMNYLISDLLNVSRLRTGKFVIEKTPANLADVVQGEIDQVKETARAHGLKLTYKKPKDFPTISIDETKTRQVIMNFVDNAIYYTPSGGEINVELEAKAKTVEYRVVDNGLGVPKSEQHNLFNKFYRANNAKKARPDGTGLGLFMAKKVVIAQGGAIIFKSTEGKGSTFGFSLPITDK